MLVVCAGTAAGALADHRGPEPGSKQKQQERARPSRAAEKCLSTCKPRLNRMDNEAKHGIRDAMRAGLRAMEDAAEAEPQMTPEEIDALLKGAIGAVEDAAAAARAALDAKGEEVLKKMMGMGASEGQLDRARKLLGRLGGRIDDRADEAAERLRERYEELFGDESEDDPDEPDCDDPGSSPPSGGEDPA